MKKFVSNSFKLFAGSMVALSTPVFMNMTSCSSSDAIEFANYESYMADDLIEDLQQHYNVHFPRYTVAEMIPAKFEKFYDCAVPTGYGLMNLISNDWLTKIDWSKFEITIDGALITDADTALDKLFVGEVEGYSGIASMNDQFGEYIKNVRKNNPNAKLIKVLERDKTFEGDKFNILNYGVPYFAQSYMFAYAGDELTFYHNNDGTPEITKEPTWADIFYTISPSNPNQDARFKTKKIGMVDDARSFHDVSRIVESKEDGESSTLDPIEGASIDRVKQTMQHVTNKFAGHKSSFVLNSDSGIVSRALADRKGDQTAVLSWSGDTIYAAQGAEEFESFTSENFHIQKPSDASFDEIEYVVINKKNEANTNKLNKIYSLVKQVCLDGCDKDAEEICKKIGVGDDERYLYWAMDNWDTVMYTPLLKSVYSVITSIESKYWEEQMKSEGYDENTVKDLFVPILNGQIPTGCKHLYGKTLTSLQNSNNHWAWLEERGKL